MDTEQQQALEQQHELKMERVGAKAAANAAMQKQQKKLENPEFLGQLQNADVDTEVFDWVADEAGPVFSGAHILGHRSEHYEEQQDLLNRNKGERLVAEQTPGRLLRENPRLLALAMGLQGTEQYPDPTDQPEFRAAMSSPDKRVMRDAMEVATNRQSLSIGGRGVDAVSNVTVENRSMAREETSEDSVAGRVKEVFR